MRSILVSILSLIAGFVGGIAGSRLYGTNETAMHARPGNSEIVRSSRYELVDQSGVPIAFWGIDSQRNVTLAFLGPVSRSNNVRLDDPSYQRVAVGIASGGVPRLLMNGEDGKPRVGLTLGAFDKPTLWMEDEKELKITLGSNQADAPDRRDNDWSLAFHPDRASIGFWQDPDKHVRAYLSIDRKKRRAATD